jgi:multiple sugar transport system permease protein
MPVYRAIYFLPVVISLAAWSMVWRVVFQPEGPLNGALALVGVHGPNWLASTQVAMVAVIAVAILKNVGFTMVLFHAALQNVPRDVIEAARIDGAGDWAMFRHITLPLIAPFTFLVVILTTINSFKTFAMFYVMTNGGPGDATRTLAFYIYDLGFRFSRAGYASALAVVLFVAVLILTLAQFVIRQKWVHNDN